VKENLSPRPFRMRFSLRRAYPPLSNQPGQFGGTKPVPALHQRTPDVNAVRAVEFPFAVAGHSLLPGSPGRRPRRFQFFNFIFRVPILIQVLPDAWVLPDG